MPTPREALRTRFAGAAGEILDDGIALWFPGPASFTGEDVLELQGHGGPVVLDMVLARVVSLGARLARPGEFSERAFLNGKLDLSQAEAIADLIDASSQAAARGAARTLNGEFSKKIKSLVDGLIRLRVFVEGSLDFPDDEDVDAISTQTLITRLDELLDQHGAITRQAKQGTLLREGVSVAILGAPNVGKSSLLNRLVGRDAAIVTNIPGTTRDAVRESLHIQGVPVHLVDTAGLRPTTDPVESIGIERAWAAAAAADVVLQVFADGIETNEGSFTAQPNNSQCTVVRVHNKIDLTGALPGERYHYGLPTVFVSAETSAGIDALKEVIRRVIGVTDPVDGLFTARRRHLDALERARQALARARDTAVTLAASELAADDLRLAQHALGEITGEFTTEDLLGEIFSTFCIGK